MHGFTYMDYDRERGTIRGIENKNSQKNGGIIMKITGINYGSLISITLGSLISTFISLLIMYKSINNTVV